MYLDIVVEIPKLKTGISRKKIKGTTYIYYEHDGSIMPVSSILYPNAHPSERYVKMIRP